MAPPQQQNSTFIDDNLDTCPSLALLNLPESPILPTKRRQNQDNDNNNNNHNQNNKQTAVEGPALGLGPQQSCKNKHSQANGNGGHHQHQQRQPRHRSISLYGVNSTVQQGQKEIPIWMDDGEPRYVSGVTNKTTCNDIIKALIDDELKTGNPALDGVHGPNGLRDYSDYILTESWGGIERSYDGNMAILPVWRAWSRVHNELRLSLKQRQHFQEPLALQIRHHTPPASNTFSLIKWLKKLFQLKNKNQTVHKPANTPPKVLNKMKPKPAIPDALQLIILPDQLYNQPNPQAKLYQLAESRSSKKSKRRRPPPPTISHNNCIRRRKDRPLRNSVRNKLATLHAEMNQRYEREYNLTRQLSEKCKLYKLQNERYKKSEMEVSVGQLQKNIEAYAEDIIKTEHELLELKNEIKHDISLINNLKRMTLEETAVAQACRRSRPAEMKKSRKDEESPQVAKMHEQEMQFVDNIYEFCDNNASMLV